MMADITCNDSCKLEIDIDQVKTIYDEMSLRLYDDMDKQYKEGKINGATYADTWAKLMQGIINGALNAVVSLQTKETDMDRCVKQAECDLKAEQENLVREQIDASKQNTENQTCIAVAECALKEEQKDEIGKESDRRNALNTEQIRASNVKSQNETCMANADCSLKSTQEDKVRYEISDVLPAQVSLTESQEKGFVDNQNIKAMEISANAWALAFSSGMLTGEDAKLPSWINDTAMNTLWENLANDIQ